MLKRLNEVLLLWMSILAFGLSACAQGQLKLVPPQVAADSDGKRIGEITGYTADRALVSFRLDQNTIVLGVEPTGFTGGPFTATFSPLFFESSNCSGTPYGPKLSKRILSNNLLIGSQLYLESGNAETKIIARSVKGTSTVNDPCQPIQGTEVNATAWRKVLDLGQEFKPPFSIR